ncbi:MAG: BREX-3 system P-loop-containing protein BrxF [Armatimonadota bacterium]
MPELLADQVLAQVPQMAGLYSRLILLVGPAGSGKTAALREASKRTGHPYVNVNLELSRRLMGLAQQQRPFSVGAALDEALREAAEVVLLDNLELLFDPCLKQDPLRCLERLGRSRTVIASWNGSVDDGHLIYAAPGHPEYRRYPISDFVIVTATTDHASEER